MTYFYLPEELPFKFDEYPFEFHPLYKVNEVRYFKFGYEIGEKIPQSADRNPGGYPKERALFIQDKSIKDLFITKDNLEETLLKACQKLRRWDAIKSDAFSEAERAQDTLKREEGSLMLLGFSEGINIVYEGREVKKTVDTVKHWAHLQKSYIEIQTWLRNAKSQFDYINGTYFNVKLLADNIKELYRNEMAERKYTFYETKNEGE